jgi:hypothetical protein
MKFNFNESRDGRVKRLFVPLSPFTFSAFVVKIKFRQPAPAWVPAFDSRPKPQSDGIIAGAV